MTAHPQYTEFISRTNGIRDIVEVIPQRRNEEIYNAISTALNSDTKIAIDIEDFTNTMDGRAVLTKMQKEYGLLCKHPQDAEDLMDELKTLTRSDNETLKSFHVRFTHKHEECAVNKVLIWPTIQAAIPTYLGNMRYPDLLMPEIVGIAMATDKALKWKKHTTLAEVRDTVERMIAVSDKLEQKYGSKNNATRKSKQTHESNKQNKQGTIHNNPTESSSTKQETLEIIRARFKEIREKLTEAGTDEAKVCSLISKYSKKHPQGCWLHNNSSTHTIQHCHGLKKLCTQVGHAATFEQCAETQNVAAARKAKLQRRKLRKTQESADRARAKIKNELKKIKALKSKLKRQTAENHAPTSADESDLEFFSSDSDSSSSDDDITGETGPTDEEILASLETNDENNGSNNTITDYSPRSTTPNNTRIIAKLSRTTSNNHSQESTLIIDICCTTTIDPDVTKFEYITPIRDQSGKKFVVEQCDGSHIQVEGQGYKLERIQGKIIRTRSLYVPKLSCALYSITQHMKHQGCYFHAEHNKSYLAFPTFIIPIQTTPEMQVTATPVQVTTPASSIHYDEETATVTTSTKYTARIARADDGSTITSATTTHNVHLTLNHPEATIPQRSTPGSVGYDVTSTETVALKFGETIKISTGLTCTTTPGTYIRIAPRSSLSKAGLTVEGGVIDNDYTGDIGVLLHNQSTTKKSVLIKAGQGIAQFIFESNSLPCLTATPFFPKTSRGQGGFGSTGKYAQQTRRITHEVCPQTGQVTSTFLDRSKKTKPKAKRLAHPISTGVHHPSDAKDVLPTPELTSKNPHLKQTHPNDKPIAKPIIPTAPRVRPSEKVNNSSAQQVQKTQDNLAQLIGYLKPDKLLKHIKTLGTGSVTISGLHRNPRVDPGETASIRKARRNLRKKSSLPASYSDIWYMDIGFGPCTGKGGNKYCLLLVDKYSRYKFVYGLQNLTTSLLQAMKCFLKDVKVPPTFNPHRFWGSSLSTPHRSQNRH